MSRHDLFDEVSDQVLAELRPGLRKCSEPSLRDRCNSRAATWLRQIKEASGMSGNRFADEVLQIDPRGYRMKRDATQALTVTDMMMLPRELAAIFLINFKAHIDARDIALKPTGSD
jgi:hypothetical protein